jgi:hypothetical protein
MGIHCLMGYLGIIQPDSVDGMGLWFTFDHVWKGSCVTWSICRDELGCCGSEVPSQEPGVYLE